MVEKMGGVVRRIWTLWKSVTRTMNFLEMRDSLEAEVVLRDVFYEEGVCQGLGIEGEDLKRLASRTGRFISLAFASRPTNIPKDVNPRP